MQSTKAWVGRCAHELARIFVSANGGTLTTHGAGPGRGTAMSIRLSVRADRAHADLAHSDLAHPDLTSAAAASSDAQAG